MNEEIREAIRVSVMATLESCMANYQLAPMLTLEEIAERTQVSKDTIRAAVDAGELRVYQISARLPRFRVADVNAWIDRLAVATEKKPEPPPMPPLPEVIGDLSDLSDLTDGVGEAAVVKENLTTGTPTRVDEKPEEKPEVAQAAPEAPAPEAEQSAAPVDEKPVEPKPVVQPEEPAPAPPVAEAPEERAAALDDAERCPVCAPDGRRCTLPAGHEGKHRLIKKEN